MSNLKEIVPIHPLSIPKDWVLKKLKDKHKTIIALHIQNVKRAEIALIAECTPEYVSMILRQPLAQEYLKSLEQYTDDRLKATYGKAVDALEDCLVSGDEDVKLRAAKLALEANGKMKQVDTGTKTAEDLVGAILANASTVILGQNVQVNTLKDQGDSHGSISSIQELREANSGAGV